MRILIDECLPAPLRNPFTSQGHECRTVREIGLAGKKNGELLSLADGTWDVLLTNDRKMKHQQNMTGRTISLVVFVARSNRLRDILPLVPACVRALSSIRPGQIVEVGSN